MGVPSINISFQNGTSGTVIPAPDKVLGLVCNAVAVSTTFVLNTPYIVKGMVDVASLGIIDSVANHLLYKTLKEFYLEAGEGTELWIMGVERTKKISEVFTVDSSGVAPIHTLLNTANGRLRGVITKFNPDNTYVNTLVNGMDSDFIATLTATQNIAENYTATKKAPFFVLVEGYNFNGNITSVPDLTERSDNRVGVLLGDTEKRTGVYASRGSAIGILGGRIAKNQVQVNIGRLRDGEVNTDNIYYLDTPAEQFDIESLHDKGYITFRQHVSKSGYYFTDSPLACDKTDDYATIENRRVIDKAFRIGYAESLNFLLDDFNLLPDGTLSPIDATTIVVQIEQALYNQMTINGELSSDPTNKDDLGVIIEMDLTNNVRSTSQLKFKKFQVKPKGYARYIDVPLGFASIQ